MPPSSKSPYRLIVEGPDDKHAILGLLQRHGFDWNDETTDRPYVEVAGGVDSLLEAFPTALKRYHRLGVVLDADGDALARWQSVRDRARHAGVHLPEELALGGTIAASTQPSWQCGVWLMPDNQARGALEDFLTMLVPQGDSCWEHARVSTVEARAKGGELAEKDELKGMLHAWLSWQRIPGQPFGTAITARTFRHDTSNALSFVAWFRGLFATVRRVT